MSCLPAAANSGQYLATGAARSRSPRSARISAHSAVIVLVVEKVLRMESRCQGVVRAASAYPPHRSTTGSPSRYTATEAPTSCPSSDASSVARTPLNRSEHVP